MHIHSNSFQYNCKVWYSITLSVDWEGRLVRCLFYHWVQIEGEGLNSNKLFNSVGHTVK